MMVLLTLDTKSIFVLNIDTTNYANGKNHINGIESFWSFAKRRLSKFHGISKTTFNLHLKECEFRFNNRSKNVYQILLNEIRNRPLN